MLAPDVFPIRRKKMYLFFAITDIFVAVARYFMIPDKGLPFYLGLYVLSVLGFFLLWEIVVLSGRLLEPRLPIASSPFLRVTSQTLILYLLIISPSFFIHSGLPQLIKAIGYVFYFMVSFSMNLVYFGVIYFSNWKRDLVNLANMQREQAVVNYDILRNQLNPHFLFNALTSLNSLIFENQELASEFLQQLSKVYRYTLQNKDKETVSVKTELDFVSNYMSLLKTRFGDAIDFRITVDEKAREKGIVPVITQMLIENAVKHNIISLQRPLKVSITNNDTFLIIENSINRKDQAETSNKLGLQNLKMLYRYLTEKPVEVTETESSFNVKVPLV